MTAIDQGIVAIGTVLVVFCPVLGAATVGVVAGIATVATADGDPMTVNETEAGPATAEGTGETRTIEEKGKRRRKVKAMST